MMLFFIVFSSKNVFCSLGADGGELALENKKSSLLSQQWDKSCAPAIPPKLTKKFVRSLMRTIIRIPIDNGRDPVGIYSSKRFFKPPSEVHSFRTDDRDLTTHDSLNNGFPELLLFVTGLMLAL